MTNSTFAFLLAGAATLSLPAVATAGPRGTYESGAPGEFGRAVPHAGETIIYLNGGGGTYYPGYNNAATNRSTIVNSTSTISAFEQGPEAWAELLACVRFQYAPFNVIVTDQNPGNVDHIEAVVGGTPAQIGKSGIGGIAPITNDCSPYDSAIVFNFSTVYPGDMEELCFTVAQEVGHAIGLDHVMLCEDPMTYLSGCGFKSFRNQSAPCGEDKNRTCRCGGSTQNSVAHFNSWLGTANDVAAPTVTITSPSNGGYAAVGFTVTATATDDRAVASAEMWIDGTKISDARFGPYAFTTSPAMGLGQHTIEIRVKDAFGKTATATATVTVTVDGNAPQCAVDADCGPERICYNLQCWDADNRVGLGETCAGNEDCISGLCASDGTTSVCTKSCVDTLECDEGYDCLQASSGGVCWPRSGGSGDGDGGGCASAQSGGPGAPGVIALALLALFGFGRRRQRLG